MSEITIKVRDIGKEYRIGETNEFQTMRENITRLVSGGVKKLVSGIGGKRGGNGHAAKKASRDNIFWSLKDVSFNVCQGEIIGIIGRNGAGKSTLLKIITGITEPTEGRIDIYGRIASLLEVGTGFHLELTGRENIYLNGAILGMKKSEIDRKFDEILEFSEVEQFIDTPVKYYSSGMRVRLGFSVAAHLEPEILLIDEVLAVGDAAFQKKCLGKLNNVATSEGRTVLFVSHDMTAILSLCQRAIMLEQGRVIAEGHTDDIVEKYLQSMSSTYEIPLDQRTDHAGDESVTIVSLKVENAEAGTPIKPSSRINIKFDYVSDKPIKYPRMIVKIRDFRTRVNLARLDSEIQLGLPETLPPRGTITCSTGELLLTPGRCVIDVELKRGMVTADRIEHAGYFDIETENVYGTGKIPTRDESVSLLKYEWQAE